MGGSRIGYSRILLNKLLKFHYTTSFVVVWVKTLPQRGAEG